MPTRLFFTEDEYITVDEDINAVESAFRTAAPHPAPLAESTKQGQKILVNVGLVRYFKEPGRGSARVVSG